MKVILRLTSPSMAYVANEAICAPAAIESHVYVLLSSAILLHTLTLTFVHNMQDNVRRRALCCVAFRRKRG